MTGGCRQSWQHFQSSVRSTRPGGTPSCCVFSCSCRRFSCNYAIMHVYAGTIKHVFAVVICGKSDKKKDLQTWIIKTNARSQIFTLNRKDWSASFITRRIIKDKCLDESVNVSYGEIIYMCIMNNDAKKTTNCTGNYTWQYISLRNVIKAEYR